MLIQRTEGYMRKMFVFAIAALLLGASQAVGQATSYKVLWDYQATTPAVVATYTQVLTINGIPVAGTPTCAASGANTTCEVTINSPLPAVSTVYAITATLNGISASVSRTVNPSAGGPAQPGIPRIQVTVVVTS